MLLINVWSGETMCFGCCLYANLPAETVTIGKCLGAATADLSAAFVRFCADEG